MEKEHNLQQPAQQPADIGSYAPLVSKAERDNYVQDLNRNVRKLFADLLSHPLLDNTYARHYRLKFTDHQAIDQRVSYTEYYPNYAITISSQAVSDMSFETIREILIHQIAHVAQQGHYHDFVWQRFVKNLGGDPRIRSCGLIKPNYKYTLCCPNPTCNSSTSELRVKVGGTKKCNKCKTDKVHIPN